MTNAFRRNELAAELVPRKLFALDQNNFNSASGEPDREA